MQVHFYALNSTPAGPLQYAVIAARRDGQWLFCRHKARDTWEMPGGHIEQGETPAQAATRELYEETGCQGALTPLCIYGVEREGSTICGMLFLCDVQTVDALPACSEMAEICWRGALPGTLTYPAIQPHLHNYVQGYLNTLTAPDEIWDVLDKNKQPTGRTMRRIDPIAPGDYHLVVDVWMRRQDGLFLLTQRAPTKGFPLMWETTGGSAAAGEDSLTAALREAREEAGMVLDPGKGRLVHSYRARDHFKDVWLFDHEAELADVVLQEGETVDARLATQEEILQLYTDNQLVPYTYLEDFLNSI